MSDPSAGIADALRDALAPRTSLVHPTYRHLSRPITVAGLTIAQWVTVLAGLAATWALSSLLPLSTEWSLSIGGSLVGIPAALLFVLFADGEFSLRAIARSVIAWRRCAGVLLPTTQGSQPAGYQLHPDKRVPDHTNINDIADPALEQLWAS
jgi:hypothetical protein